MKKNLKKAFGGIFTMVEILIVIVIFIILFAILLPRLTRAKEYARQKYCMNNMRQIALAFKTYKEDFGMMPVTTYWLTDLSPAYENAKDLKVFKCPSSTTPYLSSEEDLYQRTEEEFEENYDKIDYYLSGKVEDIELRNSLYNNGLGNNAYHFDISNPGRITQTAIASKKEDEILYEKNYDMHFNSFNIIYINDLHYEVEKSGVTAYWTLDERGWIDTSLDAFPERE